jgi:hypothetical protein
VNHLFVPFIVENSTMTQRYEAEHIALSFGHNERASAGRGNPFVPSMANDEAQMPNEQKEWLNIQAFGFQVLF